MTRPPPIATQVLLTASMELGRSGNAPPAFCRLSAARPHDLVFDPDLASPIAIAALTAFAAGLRAVGAASPPPRQGPGLTLTPAPAKASWGRGPSP
jgi:hypothetical protein